MLGKITLPRILEVLSVLIIAIPLYLMCLWFSLLKGKWRLHYTNRTFRKVCDIMLYRRFEESKRKFESPRFIDGNGHDHNHHHHRRGHRGGRKHRKHFKQ